MSNLDYVTRLSVFTISVVSFLMTIITVPFNASADNYFPKKSSTLL